MRELDQQLEEQTVAAIEKGSKRGDFYGNLTIGTSVTVGVIALLAIGLTAYFGYGKDLAYSAKWAITGGATAGVLTGVVASIVKRLFLTGEKKRQEWPTKEVWCTELCLDPHEQKSGELAVELDKSEIDPAVIRHLLDEGADPETQGTKSGYSAVHIAVFIDDSALARFAIEKGVSPSLKDKQGRIAIDYVTDRKDVKMFLAACGGYNLNSFI